jgi:four helix bundle protein
LWYQSSEEKDGLSYDQWEQDVPLVISDSPLGILFFYRKALYLYDLAWDDCQGLMRDIRGKAVASQLIRSIGSISANMEEGYSRGFERDYARFLRIALGEARESQGWYYRGRRLLTEETIADRLKLLDEVIR